MAFDECILGQKYTVVGSVVGADAGITDPPYYLTNYDLDGSVTEEVDGSLTFRRSTSTSSRDYLNMNRYSAGSGGAVWPFDKWSKVEFKFTFTRGSGEEHYFLGSNTRQAYTGLEEIVFRLNDTNGKLEINLPGGASINGTHVYGNGDAVSVTLNLTINSYVSATEANVTLAYTDAYETVSLTRDVTYTGNLFLYFTDSIIPDANKFNLTQMYIVGDDVNLNNTCSGLPVTGAAGTIIPGIWSNDINLTL